MTSRIGYYSDDTDPHADEDPDEIRERAFRAWRKLGAAATPPPSRLAREYAQDLGFDADGRAIRSALESPGSLVTDAPRAGQRRRDARTRRHCAARG